MHLVRQVAGPTGLTLSRHRPTLFPTPHNGRAGGPWARPEKAGRGDRDKKAGAYAGRGRAPARLPTPQPLQEQEEFGGVIVIHI